jgi:uncharacterized protein (UPF0335 family)
MTLITEENIDTIKMSNSEKVRCKQVLRECDKVLKDICEPTKEVNIDKRLYSFISRIENLEEEKKALTEDIKEVYAEAKSSGYDAKIMRKIIAERKKDEADRQEEALLLETYRNALGMLADTPLGQASLNKVA